MAMARKLEDSSFKWVDTCIRNLQDCTRQYRYKITSSPATREAAMAGIVGELEAGNLPFEELDLRCLIIFALSGISIKKGTPRETRLACRAVALLLLTLCDGSSGLLLDEAFPALSKAIQTTQHNDVPTLLVAINCLAIACFAGARRAEEAMDAIWRVVIPPVRSRSGKPKARGALETIPVVVIAALSAWTFLLTTVTTNTHRKKADRRPGWSTAIASLAEMLDNDDRRIRMATGEALVVCVELNILTGKDMDALAAKVSDLAAESPRKGADNSLLREQKELFGRIATCLDHGEPPPAASSEWHNTMKVSTGVRVQLNFLSKFLGNGFLRHVQSNPLLNEAFRFGRVEGNPLSVQKEESIMEMDIFSWDLRCSCPWVYNNILMVEITKRLPQKLLRLGWH